MTLQPSANAMPDFDHPHMRSLEGWYIMNQGGFTLYDYSGNGNHATGFSTLAGNRTSKFGNAKNFVNHTDAFLTGVPALTRYTVVMTVMSTGFPSGLNALVGFAHPSNSAAEIAYGAAIGGFGASSFEFTGYEFEIRNANPWFIRHWYTIVIVREGNNITNGYKGYFEGRRTAQRNSGLMNITGSNNWYIGAIVRGGSPVDGTEYSKFSSMFCDNIRIYSDALDAKTIAEIANDPYAPFGLNKPFPFPPTGLTAVRWGPVGRGRIRSAIDLGSNRIGGAP